MANGVAITITLTLIQARMLSRWNSIFETQEPALCKNSCYQYNIPSTSERVGVWGIPWTRAEAKRFLTGEVEYPVIILPEGGINLPSMAISTCGRCGRIMSKT